MLDRFDSEFSFLRTAQRVRNYRQELIASNIANADTPNYKARDVDFKSALAKVTSGQTPAGALRMAETDARHIGGNKENPLSGLVQYRSEYQGAVDGNTVNMDVEVGSYAENSIQMEALINFISNNVKIMQSAMSS
jgi:flagellar basal-body rod protein FlgB